MLRNKSIFIIFILFLIYLFFTSPFWTGELFRNVGDFPNRQVNIPKEYYQLSNIINENRLDAVVFPVPITKIGMGSFWWNGGKDGYASVYPFVFMLSSKRTFYVDFESVNDYNLSKILTDKRYLKFLGFQNVSTLIFHNDTSWGTVTDSPYWYPNNIATFNLLLEKIKSAYPKNVINIGSLTTIDLVNNDPENFLPHIYTTNKMVVSGGEVKDLPDIVAQDTFGVRTAIFFKSQGDPVSDFKDINTIQDDDRVTEFKNINPTKYRLVIHHASKPFLLAFNEQYHPDWRLYLVHSSKSTTGSAFISKNYQGTIQNDNLPSGSLLETITSGTEIKTTKHLQVNGYANSWTIDPDQLCRGSNSKFCIKNPDGTYDFSLIIEFWPQHLFYLGLAISLTTLFLCFAYILITHWQSKITRKQNQK